MTGRLLKCLILDDEPVAVRLLASYVGQTPGLVLVHQTTRSEEALAVIQKGEVDLLFLDIQMPEWNGLDFMQRCDARTAVILTTAYRQFAVEAFEKEAADYLVKPISYERFRKAVEKVQKQKSNESVAQDHVFVKVGFQLQRIGYDQILYMEALRDYVAFHTVGGKVLAAESMTLMENTLPAHRFLRIHRSFIINRDKISSFQKWAVVINGQSLPVGATYRDNIIAVLGIH